MISAEEEAIGQLIGRDLGRGLSPNYSSDCEKRV
jgi:hypothetical protein